MAIRSQLATLSENVTSALAHLHHSRTQGDCPHCAAQTPWIVRPLSGFYRCLDCGNDPLDAARDQ